MKPTPEAVHTRKDDHRKQPRMKGCTKHRLTAAVLAAGADEAGFIADGSAERRRPRRAKQERAE